MIEIILEKIRLYAYHGCLKEERIIGSEYEVQISVFVDATLSTKTDRLNDTVDYEMLFNIVKEEMAIPSNLLEHVCNRIVERIGVLEYIAKTEVIIKKINPPLGGQIGSVNVKICR